MKISEILVKGGEVFLFLLGIWVIFGAVMEISFTPLFFLKLVVGLVVTGAGAYLIRGGSISF